MKIFVTFALLATSAVSAAKWGYEGTIGPLYWAGICAEGREQSPIDFPRAGNTKAEMEPFTMENYDVRPAKMELSNNGHTVVTSKLEMHEGTKAPTVSGGGLPATYQLAQFHLHWGSDDGRGSEHTINGEKFPMEVHLVHFNTEYGSTLTEAISSAPAGSRDALAVLGVMFQVERRDNTRLMPVLDALKPIVEPKKATPMEPFAMADLLPRNTLSFYRYNGSLTTPGCNEIVVWTVFKEPIEISSKQMQKFREVAMPHANRKVAMVNNYRPVQPLNGRQILDVFTGTCNAGAPSRLAEFSFVWIVSVVSLFVSRVMH